MVSGAVKSEEPLARAQNDRMDNKAVLVDQPGLDQRASDDARSLLRSRRNSTVRLRASSLVYEAHKVCGRSVEFTRKL